MEWTEIGWLVSFADRQKSDISGMDACQAEWVSIFLRKYGIDAGLLVTFLYNYSGVRYSQKDLSIGYCYDLALSWMLQSMFMSRDYGRTRQKLEKALEQRYSDSIFGALKSTIEETAAEYFGGKPLALVLKELDKELSSSPYDLVVRKSKYGITGPLKYLEDHRNRTMVETCAARLRKYDRIMAVAGAGHVTAIRAQLCARFRTEFGSCRCECLKIARS